MNEVPVGRPIWSGSGSATIIDFTGQGTYFSHWFRFLALAAEYRNRAVDASATMPERASDIAGASLSSILFSALAAEAFINELGEVAERNAVLNLPSNSNAEGRVIADLAAVLRQLEDDRAQLSVKYHMASKILSGVTFDPGKEPFQAFSDLVKIRDDLAHPRHRDRTTSAGHVEPASKIVRNLQQRGLTATKGRTVNDIPGGVSWLDEIQTPGVAEWAYSACKSIIQVILEMLPDDENSSLQSLFRTRLNQLP